MNVASLALEYYAIARVYQNVDALQQPKKAASATTPMAGSTFIQNVKTIARKQGNNLSWYFTTKHSALPLLAPFSILLFSPFAGQMTTYLLSAGFNSFHVAGYAHRFGHFRDFRDLAGSLVNGTHWTGKEWNLVHQLADAMSYGCCLIVLARQDACLRSDRHGHRHDCQSRRSLGFRSYDSVDHSEEVDDEHRGSFSSIEASLQNFFELCSFATTIVASRPSQFRWPVLMSCGAVYTAGIIYASFVRSRRGHLLHLSGCVEGDRKPRREPQWEYDRAVSDQRIGTPWRPDR